jgi:hypothetical protein
MANQPIYSFFVDEMGFSVGMPRISDVLEWMAVLYEFLLRAIDARGMNDRGAIKVFTPHSNSTRVQI